MNGNNTAIKISNLQKSFGAVRALDGVDLEVKEGTIFGLLGPNGAGKTTLVRILATLLKPDLGEAKVLNFDVVHEAQTLRSFIGLAGQYAAVDENLTGRENLELVGKLYHLAQSEVEARAENLLRDFGLSDAADRTAKTYSGGMRRRLDLAASLVGQPKILFLDEPTTGLDPKARIDLWATIKKLAIAGTTILLTTQYLDEADRLSDRIAVINHGRIIATGTPSQLKSQVGADVLELDIARPDQRELAMRLIADLGQSEPKLESSGWIRLPVARSSSILAEVIRRLDAQSIEVRDILLHHPTLDDVFLTLTGQEIET